MSLKDAYQQGLEAISYQGKSKLFTELTALFAESIKRNGGNARDISECIKRNTGLNCNFIFEAEINAYIYPVQLSTANTLLNPAMGSLYKSVFSDYIDKHQKVLKDLSDLRGEIDLENSMVSGVFSKLVQSIHIGKGLWNQLELTAEEMAAVTIHEIGHGFTFISALIETVSTNVAVHSMVDVMRKTADRKIRLQLVTDFCKATGAVAEDPEALADAKPSTELYTTLVLRKKFNHRDPRSAAGSITYDLRAAEFSADQFAARHGCAAPLAAGLDKLFRFDPSYKASGLKMAMLRAFTFALFITMNILFFGLPLFFMGLLLMSGGMENEIYDANGERLTRIRNDLVQSLKNPKLPKAERQALIQDIETVDAIRKDVKDRRGLYQYLWISLTSKRRNEYRQMRIQQDIEKLIASDLNVHSQKLSSVL